MNFLNNWKTVNENLIALILFIVFWFSFLSMTNTLNSGFHFRDDHEIIMIDKSIEKNGFINTAKSFIKADLESRFRPLYQFHRVTLVKITNKNYFIWSIYNCILAVITSFFLFLFIRRQGHKYFIACLFPLLTLIGDQSSVWWRLGTNETIGLPLLSISLFFLANSVYKNIGYQLLISIACLVLATFSKESFILLIPTYILIFLWFKHKCNPDKPIVKIIFENLLILSLLSLIMILELFIIKFFVGTNKGYAGIDNSFEISSFIDYVIQYSKNSVYIYTLFLGVIIYFLNSKVGVIKSIKPQNISSFIFNLLIFFSLIIPQFILYFKSGIWGHYLLPLVFGFSFFIYFLLSTLHESDRINFIFRKTYLVAVIASIVFLFSGEALPKAQEFANEGNSTNKFLSTIIKNTEQSDSVLVVLNSFENYEMGNSVFRYLTFEANVKNIYFLPLITNSDDEFENLLTHYFLRDFKNFLVDDLSANYSCIGILPFSSNSEIKNKLNKFNHYKRLNFDSLTLYLREKSFDD